MFDHSRDRVIEADTSIVFKESGIRIRSNHCGEIFIEDIKSGAEMRMSSYAYLEGGLEFTSRGRVEPFHVSNGMIGWRIRSPGSR